MDILSTASGRDVQMMLAVTDQLMAAGIVDMVELRRALQSRLDDIVLAAGRQESASAKQADLGPAVCPSCNRGNLVMVVREEVHYHACHECRYSRMVTK